MIAETEEAAISSGAAEPPSARAAALACIASARDYVPNVARAVTRTASLLRAGQIDDGNRLCADVADALGVLVFVLGGAARELGPEGAALRGSEAAANARVGPLLDAHARGDWIRVADALDHDVAPLLARWEQQLEALGVAGAPAGTDGIGTAGGGSGA